MNKDHIVTVRLTVAEYQELEAEAIATRRTFSATIRARLNLHQAVDLEDRLQRIERCLDMLVGHS